MNKLGRRGKRIQDSRTGPILGEEAILIEANARAIDAAEHGTIEPGASSFWSVIAAPWRFVRPAESAAVLLRAGRLSLMASFSLGAMIVLMIAFGMEVESVRLVAFVEDPRSPKASFLEIFKDALSGEGLFLHLILALVGAAMLFLAALFGGWLIMPTLVDGPSIRRQLERGFRVAVGAFGWVALLFAFAAIHQFCFVEWIGIEEDRLDPLVRQFFIGTLVTAMSGSAFALVLWSDRASNSVLAASGSDTAGPVCESCGYDLTHVPEQGRCPECGFSIEMSLTPGRLRCGCGWQRRRSVGTLVQTTVALLMSPINFYKTLHTRNSVVQDTNQFAMIHLAVAGMLAGVWISASVVYEIGTVVDGRVLIVPIAVTLLTPCAGWFIERLAAAVVTSWALYRRSLGRPERLRMIVGYETASIWLFCLFNGVLFTSFFISDGWLSNLLGIRRIRILGGVVPEELFWLVGNGFLFAVLVWRYVTAFRNTRWANF